MLDCFFFFFKLSRKCENPRQDCPKCLSLFYGFHNTYINSRSLPFHTALAKPCSNALLPQTGRYETFILDKACLDYKHD